MKEKIINLLQRNDVTEIDNFINRYLNGDDSEFFSLIDKLGILDDDEIYPVLMEDKPMTYLKYKFDNNPEVTTKFIVDEYFSDVINQNGRLMLEIGSREDLSIFFKDDGGRDMGSKEMSKLIFQEDWWEPFYDSLSSIYDEVIYNLNSTNLRLLANAINDELLDSEIEPSTELLEDIANDQGHPEYVDISVDLLLDTIFNDEKSTNAILNEASNVSSELYSLYHNAYNTAYVDEKWEQASNEIKSLLSTDNIGEWVSKKVKNYKGEEKTVNNYIIDVTNFVPYLIKSIFEDKYMLDDYRNQFEYWGNFENLIEEMIKEDVIQGATMSIGYYDYPDHNKVIQYLNDLFSDYI